MPRLNTSQVSDLEILGRLYADNVRSYHAIHLSLRVLGKASSSTASEGVEVYMTDCYKDLTLTIDGVTNVYQATGNLLAFDTIKESTDLQVSSISVTLSGVDRTFTAALLSYEYLDQPMKVYRVFLDDNEKVQHEPMLTFSGNIDTPVITDDPSSGTSTISLSAASTFIDFERRNGRKTNQSEQDLYRSINSLSDEDTGFEYNSESNTEIWWGRTTDDS
jgi:hypothetical protein